MSATNDEESGANPGDEASMVLVSPEYQTPEQEDPGGAVEVGQWYWVKDAAEDLPQWLGCVVVIGSNYVSLRGPRHHKERIHVDAFWSRCTREHDPEYVINGKVALHRGRVQDLLQEIKVLTAGLGLTPSLALTGSGTEMTQALALRGQGQEVKDYERALVQAKKEDLPKLFERVREENERAASWMAAMAIPMEAQAGSLKKLIGAIDERVFSISLYAGLTEEVVQVREGAAAALQDKICLLQRRHYMDEECLANYESGGMDFRGIGAFDAWLSRDDNFHRILPFPRCVVAFQVRRGKKDEEAKDFLDLIRISTEAHQNEWTFLYIRNGEQLYRLGTAIDFDEKLFPDMERSKLQGKIYARTFGSSINELLSEHDYLERCAVHKQWQEKKAAWDKAKEAGEKVGDRPWCSSGDMDFYEYVPWDKSSVRYDDIAAVVEAEIKAHNRVALVLQGLLDRSPVFHPHPPWQIWTDAGFQAALELVYDDSRALPAADLPDFEAYRARLNASLAPGSVAVGQEQVWLRAEAEKENARMDRDHRHRTTWRHKTYRPHGNPGPGRLAQVAEINGSRCLFRWKREKQQGDGRGSDTTVNASISVPREKLLNVSAYTPGDYKQFYADPRTRAEYLKWAPLLLAAEDFHAGKAEASEAVSAAPKKSTAAGRAKYQQKKRMQALLLKAVRFRREIETKSGIKYPAGTLWQVRWVGGDTMVLAGLREDGTLEDRRMRGIKEYDVDLAPEVVPEVPPGALHED